MTAHHHGVDDGQRESVPGGIGDEADLPGELLQFVTVYVLPIYEHGSVLRLDEAVHTVQERGFAHAVGSDDGCENPLANAERYPVEDGVALVCEADVFDVYHHRISIG